ncbi:11662_t:CDS:2 [Funneliformis caledonium]|uniref:11662_t:CDS:1 n=1 Tax=Funneliformis caledonium TaxID=1117310 RepID=A0A9N9FTI0_9GLOM|nr:11662_t:CDS:2 [Funneliformis caledonium]
MVGYFNPKFKAKNEGKRKVLAVKRKRPVTVVQSRAFLTMRLVNDVSLPIYEEVNGYVLSLILLTHLSLTKENIEQPGTSDLQPPSVSRIIPTKRVLDIEELPLDSSNFFFAIYSISSFKELRILNLYWENPYSRPLLSELLETSYGIIEEKFQLIDFNDTDNQNTERRESRSNDAIRFGTTSRSINEGHDDKHLSKSLEEYPSSYYLKEGTSTAQMSIATFQMNSTSEKELLEKFG